MRHLLKLQVHILDPRWRFHLAPGTRRAALSAAPVSGREPRPPLSLVRDGERVAQVAPHFELFTRRAGVRYPAERDVCRDHIGLALTEWL